MSVVKKILIVLVAILLLGQVPFVYRRYKLRKLAAAVQEIRVQLASTPRLDQDVSHEYKGVIHVHSFLGGHSSGSFGEIIAAAQANGLDFVIMTEHTEADFDTASMTLKGTYRNVLFVNGNETSDENGGRFLKLPQDVTLAAYPEEFKNWETPGLNGVEVYNVYSNTRRANPIVAFFDVLWSHRAYPELLFALYFKMPDESLKLWDQALGRARLTATAGNDAHANVGLRLEDGTGKTLAGIQLDPYAASFRFVRMHVIANAFPVSPESLLEAIKDGHCFIGFDLFGDTSGFSFGARTLTEAKMQGDEIRLEGNTHLQVSTPIASRMVLFRDGQVVLNESGITAKEIPITEKGVYRVEVYLPQIEQLIGEKPWIISNPIYVR